LPHGLMVHVFRSCVSLLSTFTAVSTAAAVDEDFLCSGIYDFASYVHLCNGTHLVAELNDGMESLHKLADILHEDVSTLHIYIPGGKPKEPVDAVRFKEFAKALSPRLRSLSLYLAYTKVDDKMARALATALSIKEVKLRDLTLDFGSTKITDAGIQAVASSLPVELRALVLKFGSRKVTDASIKAVSDALSNKVTELSSLDLNFERTSVTDGGIQAVASSLPQTLVNLALNAGKTQVTDASVKAVSDALPSMLQSLHLKVHKSQVGEDSLRDAQRSLEEEGTWRSVVVDLRRPYRELVAKRQQATTETTTTTTSSPAGPPPAIPTVPSMTKSSLAANVATPTPTPIVYP
jgi:hypothetical protein